MAAEPVRVVDYDPDWPRQFERLRERALRALGDLDAVVEHVGSTAVPGLAAKPVIDLDVVVRSAADVPRAIERLAGLGYAHVGDKGVPGRDAFRWPPGESRHHLYVVVDGTPAYRRHVVIRDYLRSHPEEARAYGELKQRLSVQYRSDREAYTSAKDVFTDRIMAAAERYERQLRLLAQVSALAEANGVGWWLRGGWALDFAIGEVTRPHGDIDLLVRDRDADRFAALLERHGYEADPGPPPHWQRNFRKEGEELHVALLATDERGRPATAGVPHEEFPWPEGMLDAPPGRIGELVCPVISLEAQLWAKEVAPLILGRAQRGYDAADVERLRRALARRG
jgi:GrpB-like predicted nucleotidyltransferase (UPF0157 family)